MTHRTLDAILRHAVILGALAVVLVPAARGSSEWFGWMPLWLLGMPLAAWWGLRGFPVPRRQRAADRAARRPRAQALRRVRGRHARPLARAA